MPVTLPGIADGYLSPGQYLQSCKIVLKQSMVADIKMPGSCFITQGPQQSAVSLYQGTVHFPYLQGVTVKRRQKDRRHCDTPDAFRLEDEEHGLVLEDRRKRRDRRLENLEVEERQTQLSEMPGVDTEEPE